MKIISIMPYLAVGAISALLYYGAATSRAASVTPIQNATESMDGAVPFQNVRWEEAKADTLRHAYRILARGDHDYSGHRAKAMHQIEKAAALLGVELHGGGPGKEKQVLSNVQLHEAKGMLESLLPDTHGKEHEHIRKAIDEIDASLAIR